MDIVFFILLRLMSYKKKEAIRVSNKPWLYLYLDRKEAELEMEGHFLVRMVYEDSLSYDLVGAASKVLSMTFITYLS